jgi:hypothetical protein
VEEHLMNTLETLDILNRAIARSWPELSSWWMETLTRFVASRRRQLVARVGRRGGKSSTLCRFAVAFALAFDCSKIPPGDVGVVAFISVSRDEASQRLRMIRALLDALGVAWHPVEGGVELDDRPIVFKIFTGTIAGVSGFTAILVILDEVAKMRDAETGANPATEVLASVRPTMATQPDARIILSSSPMGNDDAHAKAFDMGESDFQVVAYAPTWEANPNITEQETHDLEPDPRVWAREYQGAPQDARCAAFETLSVLRAFETREQVGAPSGTVCIIDASSTKQDDFAYGFCSWRMVDGKRRLYFDAVSGFPGGRKSADDPTRFDAIVAEIAAHARRYDVTHVFGDQRDSFPLESAFRRQGLKFTEVTWTPKSKEEATMFVRRLLADDLLILPEHSKLKSQLLGFEEKFTASGMLTFGARGTQHDDYASLLLTAAMADQAKHLYGSPYGRKTLTQLTIERWREGRRDPMGEVVEALGGNLTHLRDYQRLRGLIR